MMTTIHTTRTANLLVRDATGEVLREAHDFEVAAARASGVSWLPYTLLCPAGEISCFIEQREIALTDAEYNTLLVQAEGDELAARPRRASRNRRS